MPEAWKIASAQGGGGSGAARVEKAETVESVLADAGYTGGDSVDRVLADAGYLGEGPSNPTDPDVIEGAQHTLDFQKEARAAYERFGPGARSVDELETSVDRSLTGGGRKIYTAATTDSSGNIAQKFDPNPFTSEATGYHENVHQQTTLQGIARFGGGVGTPAFDNWYFNPQNWATDEVNAYSAGIWSLQTSILFSFPYSPR